MAKNYRIIFCVNEPLESEIGLSGLYYSSGRAYRAGYACMRSNRAITGFMVMNVVVDIDAMKYRLIGDICFVLSNSMAVTESMIDALLNNSLEELKEAQRAALDSTKNVSIVFSTFIAYCYSRLNKKREAMVMLPSFPL